MNQDLKRLPNEDNDQYFYRVCSMKDALGFTWPQMAEIFNNEFGSDCGESAYRKKWNAFESVFTANEDRLVGGTKYLDEIKAAKYELEKERKKLQTEKLEYNKWLREEARDELIVEKITDDVYGKFLPSITKVLLYKKKPVGFCFANLTNDKIANVPIVAISKKHRHYGFGKILLKQLVDNLLTTSITSGWTLKELNASCDSDNESAVNMYTSIGFTEEYTYPQAYHQKTV